MCPFCLCLLLVHFSIVPSLCTCVSRVGGLQEVVCEPNSGASAALDWTHLQSFDPNLLHATRVADETFNPSHVANAPTNLEPASRRPCDTRKDSSGGTSSSESSYDRRYVLKYAGWVLLCGTTYFERYCNES